VLYFAVGMAVVTVTMAIAIHDSDKGIQRNWRNDWFVGVGSAMLALGYAAKAFWRLRANWRLWALIAAFFALFTATTIPVLSQMEKVPLLLAGPLANVEFLIAFGVIHLVMGGQSRRPSLTP
jgi:hypothetical protein